jgi:ubiquinone/menaquinone biosynthesis C-methylase UbiE
MLYKCLPDFMTNPLLGKRKLYHAKNIDHNDPEWIEWKKHYDDYYKQFHGLSLGLWMERQGHGIIKHVDLNGKTVVEAGPGMVMHLKHTSTRPQKYILMDISKDFLEESRKHIKAAYGIDGETILTGRGQIPLPDNTADVFLTFQQLEHVDNLEEYVKEIKRVIKPGGLLVGAVPAEGGILFGIGRYFTTRRMVHKLYNVDYDKIICWEHPNFVDKIKSLLDTDFVKIKSVNSPLPFLPMDLCATWSFIYQKQ